MRACVCPYGRVVCVVGVAGWFGWTGLFNQRHKHHPPNQTNQPINTNVNRPHRPYFLGFGLLPACITSLLPFFVGVGAYAMVFPIVRSRALFIYLVAGHVYRS